MAKLSGLIDSGKIGQADQKTIDAMPNALMPDANKRKNQPQSGSQAYGSPGGDVLNLDIATIKHSPFQVLAIEDNEYIETLMSSITKSGVISSITVRVVGAGDSYEIIAGHHRLEACKRLGMTQIPASIRTMTDHEAACALASDNFIRKELSDYQRYKYVKMLKDNGSCKTQSEIASVLGISRPLVSFLSSFDDFPEEAKEILDCSQNILGANIAAEIKDLAKVSPSVFTDAIALLAQGKLRQNQVRHWIESQNEPSQPKTKNRQEVKIQRPGLRSPVKIIYTDKETKIQTKGLNVEKLKALIESNLEELLAN